MTSSVIKIIISLNINIIGQHFKANTKPVVRSIVSLTVKKENGIWS
jgi:hypothetical protein